MASGKTDKSPQEKPGAMGGKIQEKNGQPGPFSAFIETAVDKIGAKLEAKKSVSLRELAAETGLTIDSVEGIALLLEKEGVVGISYPAVPAMQPAVSLKKKVSIPEKRGPAGKALESYSFASDSVNAVVRIMKIPGEERPLYALDFPKAGPYTEAFMPQIREAIASKIPVEASEIIDPKKGAELKKKFFDASVQEFRKYLKTADEEALKALSGIMLHSMYGLGRIELLMADNMLEEVTINSSQTPVMVYHLKHGWMKTNVFMGSEDETYNLASQIARKAGREITTLNPILDAHLLSGDRVNATLQPISSYGNTITIRRFARRPWTITDFIGQSHVMSVEMASLLWLAMQYEMNILIAGGTASGKTSVLNALSAFIPSYHRIISIEDVREIMLPEHMRSNWVPLTTRNPNPEGQGQVSMLELMQSSLRMRPDRIILGEIRREREAEVLFEAMHTGHSVYSTIHANSSQQVLRRLTEPPINIPPLEVEAIDFVLVQHRDRRLNTRRTFEIAEIESGVSGGQLEINTVFKWQPREDEWESVAPATKFVRTLNLHTGMTESEIGKELEARAAVLQWMLDNSVSGINEVGKVMNAFYTDSESFSNAVAKNLKPKDVLEV